jgi:thiol:disulfide interchange protein
MKKALLFLFAFCLSESAAFAAATAWQTNPQGKVRLIIPYKGAPKDGTIYIGLHFKPAPGWMVYWKVAGDAGYPPKFTFNDSRGIKNPEILWPRPRLFTLPGNIREYGYDSDVVYPIRAQSDGKGNTIHLAVVADYLTCKEICVPHKVSLTLDVPRQKTPQPDPEIESLIQKFILQVPPADEDVLASLQPGVSKGLLWILLLGFLGGLILNVMPCVLPILSIKLFGLLEHSGEERIVIVRDALSSAAGILFSFLLGGAIAIGARQAGLAVGWGVQFQDPRFIAALAVIVTLFALNLWGVFEIDLPPAIARLGAIRPDDEGALSYFVSGMFATLMATPCSAPFLGTAMGFALSQTPATILAVFGAAGIGMALPYLALAAVPHTLHWLPRPGAWMVKVRVVLGWFLAATVGWLGYVLAAQVDSSGLAAFTLALLAICLLAWAKRVRGQMRKSTWFIWAAIVLVIFGLARSVTHHRESHNRMVNTAGGLPWEPFDLQKIATYQAAGKSVFVDVTADWCFTCTYNERVVLNDAEVARTFQEQGIVLMKADWTNHDASIGEYLKKFNRYGIPFYVLYRPGQTPVVFSELHTKRTVLRTITTK